MLYARKAYRQFPYEVDSELVDKMLNICMLQYLLM